MFTLVQYVHSLAFEGTCEPPECLLEPSALHRGRLKHLPLAILYLVEAQAGRDFVVVHGAGHVLFIGEDQDGDATQLVLL